ncbi:MAG: hypothetical protein N4A50_13465 [Vallitalea sp.]|jgi:hypothetical protein|nr:hypothetical protein [Vallitalea sp.]
MGKVTVCTDKYLDGKPIVVLLESELFELKLFYKTEDIRELKEKYSKYIMVNSNFNIYYNLLKTREILVTDFFFKIVDLLSDNYAIVKSDFAKYKVCDKTIYFDYNDLSIDIEKKGVHCNYGIDNLYLSKSKYRELQEYGMLNNEYRYRSG